MAVENIVRHFSTFALLYMILSVKRHNHFDTLDNFETIYYFIINNVTEVTMRLTDQNIQIKSLEVSYYLPAGRRTAGHKNRASHGLVYNCGAEKIYIFESGQRLSVPPNNIIYLPKGSTYTIQTEGQGDAYAINFEVYPEADYEPFAVTPKNPDKYLSCFRKSESAWHSKSNGYYETGCEYLYRLLARIKAHQSPPYSASSYLARIAPAIDYIHENYTMENIEISHLASMCRISEVYLRKLFHHSFRQSPLQYIHTVKIKHAKDLLLSGEYTVSETAELCGFNDISHFSRTFKALTGLSPSKFSNK